MPSTWAAATNHAAKPRAAGFEGGTIGLAFLYYLEPALYDVTPLSGPTLDSNSLGMSHSIFLVTLYGRGFDGLASRSSGASRCRFGGVSTRTISVSPTHAICKLPSAACFELLNQ